MGIVLPGAACSGPMAKFKSSQGGVMMQTAYGASRMALESDKDITELRKQVTSPGGTTEQAIRVLEENNIREIFKNALDAAKKRSAELADILDKN